MKSYHAGRRKEEVSKGVLGVKRVKESTEHVCQTFATNHVIRHGFQEASMIQAAEATPPRPYM